MKQKSQRQSVEAAGAPIDLPVRACPIEPARSLQPSFDERPIERRVVGDDDRSRSEKSDRFCVVDALSVEVSIDKTRYCRRVGCERKARILPPRMDVSDVGDDALVIVPDATDRQLDDCPVFDDRAGSLNVDDDTETAASVVALA